MRNRFLFLGYDDSQTNVSKWLARYGDVEKTNKPVATLAGYDRVVLYGYRHIIRRELLDTAVMPPINLHISYLPFNRGAHPNFWCWMEETPAGVTIHELDAGVDTGPILAQKRLVNVQDNATFEDSYWQLRSLMEQVFFEKFPDILSGRLVSVPQKGPGTYRRSGELPEWVSWKMKIQDARKRFRSQNV